MRKLDTWAEQNFTEILNAREAFETREKASRR
jgi:hypothetical protein